MRYRSGLSPEDLQLIKASLPNRITRRGNFQILSGSKKDGVYQIWYGEIITGNYVAEHLNLQVAINRMKEYIEKYKDMSLTKFMDWGIRLKQCLHCKVPLVKDKKDFYCSECKMVYFKASWLTKLFTRMWGI